MRYYFAPMEGVTDSVYRRLHHKYFSGITRYYMPFISPTIHRALTNREERELPFAADENFCAVPQVLTKVSEDFLWAAQVCKDRGYEEVNLNVGCPSGTVVSKGKGSGMLRDPAALDRFLEEIFSRTPVALSVKTRLGMEDPEEFPALLEIFNRYPIQELTIHPRVRKAFYKGSIHEEMFRYAVENSKNPLCFNGNITNLTQIAKLQEQYPQLAVSYAVPILGTDYPQDTAELTFEKLESARELLEQLMHLPKLEKVHLTEPEAPAQELKALLEAYPDLEITWEKTVLDQLHTSEETEFDLSGMTLESTDPVEEAMAYFPNAQKVILSGCGLDNETLAAFREKMRQDYKVVWTVTVTGIEVRTDETIFHSSAHEIALIDEQSYDLFYCEDMIVVDIGHSHVKYIEWVKGMPNLKYLILADNWIKDLTPISSCKNLIYLELFMNNHIPDYSPLRLHRAAGSESGPDLCRSHPSGGDDLAEKSVDQYDRHRRRRAEAPVGKPAGHQHHVRLRLAHRRRLAAAAELL